jgi:hypothetical protein
MQAAPTTQATGYAIVAAYSGQGQMESQSQKRQPLGDGAPATKKFKGTPELPGDYSDAVRKKYQSASRTGQACDRCKVCGKLTLPGHKLCHSMTDLWLRSGKCDAMQMLPDA